MPRRHFVIDACALAPLFLVRPDKPGDLKCREAMIKLIKLRDDGKAILYVPNFCMAECAKAFARELGRKEKDPDDFQEKLLKHRETLLDTVSRTRKGVIRSFTLKRAHLVGVEDVFTVEKRIERRGDGGELSGLDALIASMARFQAKVYGQDNVWIVTGDEWLAKVCNRSDGLFPRAIYAVKQAIPDG